MVEKREKNKKRWSCLRFENPFVEYWCNWMGVRKWRKFICDALWFLHSYAHIREVSLKALIFTLNNRKKKQHKIKKHKMNKKKRKKKQFNGGKSLHSIENVFYWICSCCLNYVGLALPLQMHQTMFMYIAHKLFRHRWFSCYFFSHSIFQQIFYVSLKYSYTHIAKRISTILFLYIWVIRIQITVRKITFLFAILFLTNKFYIADCKLLKKLHFIFCDIDCIYLTSGDN